MPMKSEEIKKLILDSIPDAKIDIKDLRGDGDHYSAFIQSKIFTGKTQLQQHKIVYKALKGRMGEELHALALKTKPLT